MCIHEITFQRDNEANGGIGCSICNAERYRKTALGIANALEREAERQAVEIEIDMDALLEKHNAQAAERRSRMGEDYWDRRSKQAPLISAAPTGNYSAGCGMGGND